MRFEIAGVQIFGGIKRVGYVNGINSHPKGEDPDEAGHILMWDFDGVDMWETIRELLSQQRKHRLPTIYLLDTNKVFKWDGPEIKSLHAYCFRALPWRDAFQIVWDTPGVCDTYLKMAFARGFFTLRFGPKNGRGIDLLLKIPGNPDRENVDPFGMDNFVRYLTKRS